ncbi:MAG: glucose 1-dehydrogenase [Bryobacterales bacterium]|nr:glucose 1-dehydrogenase [Bryobacterales bacterium]
MNEFKGKTALITGASRGIGAATAIAYAKAGVARVIVQYNSYPEGADATVAAIREAGADGLALQADLTSNEGIESFLATLAANAPHVDILVNNAGSLIERRALVDYTPDLYDRIMNLNVKSLWFISKAVVPHMAARKWGAIINVSSIAARTGGGPGATMYAAAKAAVAAMTKGMAKELAPQGIRVNAISPGTVDNHFHEVFSTPEMLAGVVKATPSGRLGTNEDMANSILFLSSEAASYVIGQTLEINGGFYMV